MNSSRKNAHYLDTSPVRIELRYLNHLSGTIHFILKIDISSMSSHRDESDADVIPCVTFTGNQFFISLPKKVAGSNSHTFLKNIMLSIRRIFPCCRGLHMSGFPRRPTTARTRLPPTQSQISFQILTAQRVNVYFSHFSRTIATTSSTSCDAVGKIQSTHYHLIYTCKVPLFA